MANFESIKHLNRKYGKQSQIVKYYNKLSINESFDRDKIEKAIQGSIGLISPDYARYFQYGLDVNAALLFVDICSFSTRFSNLKGDKISEFFDNYYDLIIPIIYEFDGEIDKIMGDGIIAVFAPPFSDKDIKELVNDVNLCATRIIEETKGTEFSSKVAIHSGTVNYYQNKSGYYSEYTMIGKPLTELFRLESVALDECINFFVDTDIHQFHKAAIEKNILMGIMYSMPYGPYSRSHITDLKGIDYNGYYSLKV